MSQDYCAELALQHDYNHYVTTLFAPRKQRGALWAVYAFKIELERIKTLVREPMMGLIRFQWWRDAITQLYAGNTLRHQVLETIAAQLKNIKWNEKDFHDLIDAYEGDFEASEVGAMDESWEQAEKIAIPFTRLIYTIENNSSVNEAEIINTTSIFIQNLYQKNHINKAAIIERIFDKLNMVNVKSLKNTQAILTYFIIRRELDHLARNKKTNDALLSLYLWYKKPCF